MKNHYNRGSLKLMEDASDALHNLYMRTDVFKNTGKSYNAVLEAIEYAYENGRTQYEGE